MGVTKGRIAVQHADNSLSGYYIWRVNVDGDILTLLCKESSMLIETSAFNVSDADLYKLFIAPGDTNPIVHWIETPAVVNKNLIDDADDLNAYLTPGVYCRAYSASDTNFVSNCPSMMYSSTFVLEVLPAGADGQIIQRATRCHRTAMVVSERCMYNNEWGEWHTVSMNGQKVLWSGAYYMNENQTATLNDLVSNQDNGITLVFSTYTNGAANNIGFNFKFIPKHFVNTHPGCGVSCFLTNPDASLVGVKYLYIHDDKIVGHSLAKFVGTKSGITINSDRFVLRYVLGC